MLLGACSSDAGNDDATEPEPTTDVSTDGGASPGPGPTGTVIDEPGSVPSAEQFVDVYFVQDPGYAAAVPTAVPATTEVATMAIEALIAGPTAAQEASGLSSNVPVDTKLLDLGIEDGLARIDLSDEFEAGGGTFSMTARLAQVVYTLTGFSTVNEVEFWLEGEPVRVFSSEGLVLGGPVGRIDYLAALPLLPTLSNVIQVWEQGDLSRLGATAEARRVVLVAGDDTLNVRIGAGVNTAIIGMLAPSTVVGLTGPRTQVGSSTWVEIVTPAGAGWVNERFLAAVVDDDAFADDGRVLSLLDDLTAVISARSDLSDVVSARGLYVAHHADPVRFGPDQLDRLLADTTTYKWPSDAVGDDPDDLDELPSKTFYEAIGETFASTWDDPDRAFAFDEPLTGGNGRIPTAAIAFELRGFHYISVHDSGDNPDYDGLDWTTWHVSIDYEDGEPVIVGLTIDQWSP